VGTFFSAPRPSYDSVINQKMPVLSLGLGKRFGNHLTVKSTFSFQPFSSNEYVLDGEGSSNTEPIFNGYNYAFDITPIFNLMPSYHHMSRPIVDFNLGLGLGYLLTYRTEKFIFNDKNYEFSFFKHSFYVPIRASFLFRIGMLSDIGIEGAFFNTWLDNNRKSTELKKDSDHFGQLNISYKRFFR
jgi:hypothetical protein